MTLRRQFRVVALLATLVACNENPVEVRNDGNVFPQIANWNATAAPVGTSGVTATLAVKQFRGFRNEVTMSLTGSAGRFYQWRIFRGDCTNNTPVQNAQDPTGLQLFATVQSYPDLSTGTGTTATITRAIAGAMDSLSAYSVRVRVSQTSTNWNGTNPVACGNLQRAPAS